MMLVNIFSFPLRGAGKRRGEEEARRNYLTLVSIITGLHHPPSPESAIPSSLLHCTNRTHTRTIRRHLCGPNPFSDQKCGHIWLHANGNQCRDGLHATPKGRRSNFRVGEANGRRFGGKLRKGAKPGEEGEVEFVPW